ncbi:MAG: hypothetical protein JWO19_1944 [Bryobacterales bacterium]|nr:hypothetical protein [Bryobacterales bacterium]
MAEIDPRSPLLRGISQYDVDFVIPRIGVDLPLGIDPFLLYKSRDPEYRNLHEALISVFNVGIDALRRGEQNEARRILDFPEVAAIGLGYTQHGRRGSGVGTHLTELIIETLACSPELQKRGVRHVEEMQLVSAGIGPDRVSDIAANILKRFLIGYTQRQCEIWNLPMQQGVPVTHIYNHESNQWEDSYEDLPISESDGAPIIFVPRRLVRALPWINYDDFLRTEFNAYLAAQRAARKSLQDQPGAETKPVGKRDVITITRRDIALIDRYVRSREQQAAQAQPAVDYIDENACQQAESLKERLKAIPSGRERAADYQRLVLEILNFLFNPELIDGKLESRTIDGTERRDIIFSNDSDDTFWDYIRNTHDGIVIMFETKNMDKLELATINQTATYLGDRIGRFGVIVSRNEPPETIQRKIFSVWNDSASNRKVILTLCDHQLNELMDLVCKGGSPSKWMQRQYRSFREAVQ